MGDLTTSLVNTRISLQDAPDAARDLYRRLVDQGAIGRWLLDTVPYGPGPAFRVQHDFPIFDAAVDPKYRPCIYSLQIEVTDHEWRKGQDGWADLVSALSPSSGLFYNYDGGFEINCSGCGASMFVGEPGAESIEDGLNAWCVDRESAKIACNICKRAAPIREWRSEENVFAAGHLGITLSHGHITALAKTPATPEAVAIRRLLGDLTDDYAVVYCTL